MSIATPSSEAAFDSGLRRIVEQLGALAPKAPSVLSAPRAARWRGDLQFIKAVVTRLEEVFAHPDAPNQTEGDMQKFIDLLKQQKGVAS